MGVGASDLALIGLMVLAKLSSSVDDFVWLLPFVSKNNKVCFAYIFLMLFVSTCAIALAYAGDVFLSELTDDGEYWNAERTLFFFQRDCKLSTCFLFLSSSFLFFLQFTARQTRCCLDQNFFKKTKEKLLFFTITTKKQRFFLALTRKASPFPKIKSAFSK
jgi:hypothetical protein